MVEWMEWMINGSMIKLVRFNPLFFLKFCLNIYLKFPIPSPWDKEQGGGRLSRKYGTAIGPLLIYHSCMNMNLMFFYNSVRLLSKNLLQTFVQFFIAHDKALRSCALFPAMLSYRSGSSSSHLMRIQERSLRIL